MGLPRKLKKGCRTLHGNPRTKWQRKGRRYIARLFENIANTASAAAVATELLRQAVRRINPVVLSPGGIVVPQPERMMVGESTGEIVLHRPQLDQLKHVMIADMKDDVRATLSNVNLSDIFEKVNKKITIKDD